MNFQKKNLLLFGAILILAVVFWSSYEANQALTAFLRASGGFIEANPFISGLIFVALGAFSAMFFFLSSAALIPVVYFAWGPTLTFSLLLAGWLLGGAFTYAIGRYLGRPVVLKFFSSEKIDFYEGKISPVLNFPTVFLFRLAMPAEIPGYLLGMLRYHFPKYLLATALAELPFAVGAVSASDFFLRREEVSFVGLLLAGLFLVILAFYLFRRKTNNIK